MEITLTEKNLTMDEFLGKYRNKSLLEICKSCYNYNENWSCPPLYIDSDKFLVDYENINLIGIKINFSDREIESSINQDIEKYSADILREIKNKYTDLFLKREEGYEKAYLMLPGACSYCDECYRIKNKECVLPEKLRYSMDSFGFDLVSIAKSEFDVELLWGKDRLPDYYFLIFGLMH